MLIFPFQSSLAERWLNFEICDAQLITLSPISLKVPSSVFIASLNSARELQPMLAEAGTYFACGYHGCIFRTSQPIVDKWARRWNAIKKNSAGHRPRYLIKNPLFERWCVDLLEHTIARASLN